MLKKKIVMMIAAAMMTLSASSAFAAFADLELIRVIYDRSGSEVATDLGNVKTIAGTTTQVGDGGSFIGSTGPVTSGYVAYFALNRTTNELWATGSTTVPSVILGGSTGLTGMKNGTTPMYTLFNTQGGTNYTGLASLTNSYKNKVSSTQGYVGGALNVATAKNTEASLTSIIAAQSGSVTQNLYYWANGLTTVAAQKTGIKVAEITTSFDGSTNVVTATPIPAAVYLMGSGLLGLVGLRRRNKA